MVVVPRTRGSAFILLACVPSVCGLTQTSLQGVAHALEPARAEDTYHFLHISKTGGTTLRLALRKFVIKDKDSGEDKLKFHWHEDMIDFVNRRWVAHQPRPEDSGKVFFWLRAPVHRFTSGWLSRFRKGAPNYYHPWVDFERWAFTTFKTPNELACALSSENSTVKQQAESVFQNLAHLKWPLVRFFHSQDTAREVAESGSIAFVGSVEHFDEDWHRLARILEKAGVVTQAPLISGAHENPEDLDYLKELSRKAVKNLKKWYAEDYKIIKMFSSFGLVDPTYPAEVYSLDVPPHWDRTSRYDATDDGDVFMTSPHRGHEALRG